MTPILWPPARARALIGHHTSRRVANHTYLEYAGGDLALRYHATHVVRWLPNGALILDSDGWRTLTTKERINACLPPGCYIYQERGVWLIRIESDTVKTVSEFRDLMVLTPERELLTASEYVYGGHAPTTWQQLPLILPLIKEDT